MRSEDEDARRVEEHAEDDGEQEEELDETPPGLILGVFHGAEALGHGQFRGRHGHGTRHRERASLVLLAGVSVARVGVLWTCGETSRTGRRGAVVDDFLRR